MAHPVQIQVEAALEWRSFQSDVSGRWVAVCAGLDLTVEAETLDELHSVIGESIQLLMIDLLEDDELDHYLRDRGWTAVNLPRGQGVRDVEFHVPWELIAEGARGPERRAH